MKPVVILNLISQAFAPKSKKAELDAVESRAPISQARIQREFGLALASVAIFAALVLALIISFAWDP